MSINAQQRRQRAEAVVLQCQTSSASQAGPSSRIRYQNTQRAVSMNRSTMKNYSQPNSNAPIFNGNVYGNVTHITNVAPVDCIEFLPRHAAMGAMHESAERQPPPLCHPGTRDVVVQKIIGWYLDENEDKKEIMWVHAPMGYGKTAIAGTVNEELKTREGNPAIATFFFRRVSPESNSPTRFVITLAFQLARSVPELQPRINAAIKSDRGIVKYALEHQLDKLIIEPFQSLDNLEDMRSQLVIVDGIDECINTTRQSGVEKRYAEDQEAAQIQVLNLIRRLQSYHLPLCFLILSRPEAWIKRHLESKPLRDEMNVLDLYQLGAHMEDVTRFVREELSRIARDHDLEGVDEMWEEEELLVQKTEGHMIYAATILRHIDDPYKNPVELLREIIYNSSATRPEVSHSTHFSSLYSLYRQIMESCPEANQPVMIQVLEDVMAFQDERSFVEKGSIKAFDVLDRLSGRSPGIGRKALRPLHAVLRIGRRDEDIDDLFIHSSFVEFLENPHISEEFTIDRSKGEVRMLSNMLDCMTSITMDTMGTKMEPHVQFALHNWCYLWKEAKVGIFWESPETHVELLEKMTLLDLTACIVQSYFDFCSARISWDSAPFVPLFESLVPSEFFIGSLRSKREPHVQDAIDEARAHVQSSLEAAFIYLLDEAELPSNLGGGARYRIACNCTTYLQEVTAQRQWRNNQLVEALQDPVDLRKPTPFFEEVIKGLYDRKWKPRNAHLKQKALLDHLDEVIVQVESRSLFIARKEYKYGPDPF